ncbi:MAG: methyltransferase domain-containing protein [Planctomycetota bacterium]|nr:methyltransferase domain-containing protein [Planctomycetota bacterium]
MDIERLKKNWTNLGKQNPLWAILGSERDVDAEWDLDEFLATGQGMLQWLQAHLQGLRVAPTAGRALDFGCGYGRLTQALAGYFPEVVGVDIAESMLEGARAIDRSGGKCQFVHNTEADLSCFEDASFDFVMTTLVLQHMQPRYSMAYVREFLRVLRPGGVLFFQVPSGPLVRAEDAPAGSATAALEPLPAPGLRACVNLQPGIVRLSRSWWSWFSAEIHNVGADVWRAGEGPHRVQLGVRWERLDGIVIEPGRLLDLPVDVPPGQSLRIAVPCYPPAGLEQAALLVQVVEGGRWCESLGSGAARGVASFFGDAPADSAEAEAQSGGEPGAPPSPAYVDGEGADDEAKIEIYGVPIHEVCATVDQAGGEVIDVGTDNWAGLGWLSSHYTVYKRGQ